MTDAKNRMQDAFNELQRFLASFNQYETNPQKIEKEYQRLLNFGRDNPETFFKLQEGFTGNNKFKKQDVIDLSLIHIFQKVPKKLFMRQSSKKEYTK